MEILQREIFFSKQGKSSAHNHSILFTGQKKRPKARELNLIDPSDPESLTRVKSSEKPHKKLRISKPDHTFRSVSREKRELAFRNRTDSPSASLYTPKFSVVDPRVNQGPIFKTHSHKPRNVRMEVPNCMNSELQCMFPKHDRCRPRETLTIDEIQSKVKNRKILENTAPAPHLCKIDFHLQSPRRPFVTSFDPPNEERFAHLATSSFVYSKNKRPQTVSFSKMLSRKDVIEIPNNVCPYDTKENFIRPRLDLEVPNFSLMGARKPLVLKERLITPDSPALEVLERAYFKQSHVRGVHKIPKIATVTPRDDSMYRTTEAYSLNTSKYLKINGFEI